jgi:ferredoxin
MTANHATPEEAAVLTRHGFKLETAYMEVPRCATCRFWVDQGYVTEPRGVCGQPDFSAFRCGNELLETASTFGCVKWEPES